MALRGLCARLEEGLSQVAPLAHHCCRVVQLCSEGHDSAGVAHLGCDNGLSRRRLRTKKGFEHERLNQHNHDELSTNISPKIVCVCQPTMDKDKIVQLHLLPEVDGPSMLRLPRAMLPKLLRLVLPIPAVVLSESQVVSLLQTIKLLMG